MFFHVILTSSSCTRNVSAYTCAMGSLVLLSKMQGQRVQLRLYYEIEMVWTGPAQLADCIKPFTDDGRYKP